MPVSRAVSKNLRWRDENILECGNRINPLRKKALLYSVCLILIAAGLIVLDYNRLAADFDRLYELLTQARLDAIYKKAKVVVKFDGDQVFINTEPASEPFTAVIPTLAVVDYDTTLGDDMIVFTTVGTGAYNKKIHGGEIMLRSILGFRRYIHVNCTGLAGEGRYPEE